LNRELDDVELLVELLDFIRLFDSQVKLIHFIDVFVLLVILDGKHARFSYVMLDKV
jgi:hypothetical protein